MSALFGSRPASDGWFRLGRVQFTSTVLVVALGMAGLVLCAVAPVLAGLLYFHPVPLMSGEVWRIVSWPLVNVVSFWTLLNLALLWYFGTMLEDALGRNRMLRLYVEIWAALTISTTLAGLFLPASSALAGLGQIEFLVLLVWIADNPHRRFILNIPAWALGAFLLALQLLQMLAGRAWGGLLALVLALFLVGIAARRHGLLGSLTFLPGGHRPDSAPRTAARPKAKPRSARSQRRYVSDEERIDQLLDKISAQGLHGLTKAERAELEKLRKRRRG